MKRLSTILLSLIVIMALLNACEEEEEEMITNPYQRIEGKWTITEFNVLASDIPTAGSYLEFSYCESAPCSGIDYNGTDQTSGEFTFEFSEDEKSLIIYDDSGDGGSYGGTWEIIEFSNNKLRVTAETFLGNVLMEVQK